MDYRNLAVSSSGAIADHYATVTEELAEAHRRAGWLRSSIIKDTARTFQSSQESTVAARDREVRFATYAWEAELATTQAEIAALEVERDFVCYLLERS